MLYVCSESTKDFSPNKEKYIISTAPRKNTLILENSENNVMACGGGAVMDTAKIICRDSIIAYPTTAAGSCYTSHAVYWKGAKKYSTQALLPKTVIINPDYFKDLPEEVIEYTKYDATCHCIESLWSKNANKESKRYAKKALGILGCGCNTQELIEAGNLAGRAIEIAGTNIIHALSYPLTGYYDIPHGKALGFLLPHICTLLDSDGDIVYKSKVELKNISMKLIINDAFKYPKIFNTAKDVNKEMIRELFNV